MFVVAAVVYAGALLMIAAASNFDGYLIGMAVSGFGFGMYFGGRPRANRGPSRSCEPTAALALCVPAALTAHVESSNLSLLNVAT